MQVTIPIVPLEDKLVWKESSTDSLFLKEAYIHKTTLGHKIHWAKSIWSLDIPPSMCSNCSSCAKSTFHLFFQCKFAIKPWSWLATILSDTLQFNHINNI